MACNSVSEFNELYRKLKRSVELAGKSQSTLTNYARCLAHIALYFDCSPLALDEEQMDLTLKMEIGKEVFPAFIVGFAQWKSESLKLCPRPLMNRNSLKGTFPRHVGEGVEFDRIKH